MSCFYSCGRMFLSTGIAGAHVNRHDCEATLQSAPLPGKKSLNMPGTLRCHDVPDARPMDHSRNKILVSQSAEGVLCQTIRVRFRLTVKRRI